MGHVILKGLVVGDNLHGSATKDVTGADENGIADLASDLKGLGGVVCSAVVGLVKSELHENLLEAITVLGQVDGFN